MARLTALLFLVTQVQAATPDDGQAARALLEKALAYYDDYGDYAFAAFSRQSGWGSRRPVSPVPAA